MSVVTITLEPAWIALLTGYIVATVGWGIKTEISMANIKSQNKTEAGVVSEIKQDGKAIIATLAALSERLARMEAKMESGHA